MRTNPDSMDTENNRNEGIGSELLRTMDGDLDEARRLSNLFFETATDQIRQIIAAVESGQREEIVRPAHKCAGGASACGLTELSGLLRELETKALEMDPESLEKYCEKITLFFDETRNKMDCFFENKGGSEHGE